MYLYLFYIIIYLYNIVVNQNIKERALFLQTFFFRYFIIYMDTHEMCKIKCHCDYAQHTGYYVQTV